MSKIHAIVEKKTFRDPQKLYSRYVYSSKFFNNAISIKTNIATLSFTLLCLGFAHLLF
jgi:hypothetical protein